MTSSINSFSFPKNMNLTIINNSFKLSSFEKKNLTILILARYKLSFFVKQNKEDEFVNSLLGWLEENIIDYKEIELLYTTYYNTKDGTPLKKDLFKLVKPLEELATYLSRIAEINKESDNELTDQLFYIKLYTLYLLYLWFEVDCKETYYFKDIHKFNFTEELRKINCLGLKNIDTLEDRVNIRMIIDKSKYISTFLTGYSFKISIKPKGSYKNRDKRRK
jgi:hypothetical protein